MADKPEDKFRIICDTREQTPWKFNPSKYCLGTVNRKVEHGDYSIEGMEHLVFLERKASAAEIAQNVIQKRFENLLLASEPYKYKYIICEFSLSDVLNYPYGSGLPKSVIRKIRIKGNFIMSKLFQYELEHGVHIIYCGNKVAAKEYALGLMKRIYNKEK